MTCFFNHQGLSAAFYCDFLKYHVAFRRFLKFLILFAMTLQPLLNSLLYILGCALQCFPWKFIRKSLRYILSIILQMELIPDNNNALSQFNIKHRKRSGNRERPWVVSFLVLITWLINLQDKTMKERSNITKMLSESNKALPGRLFNLLICRAFFHINQRRKARVALFYFHNRNAALSLMH